MATEVTRYRTEIDGLRALAVLAVVAFHAFPSIFPGGFIGVDIFFVISGYLITLVNIPAVETGTFKFKEFYARRIRRLFPALAVVIATTLLLGSALLFADEFKLLGQNGLAGALFVSNFYSWSELGYFDTQADLKPLLHLWSLATEEQFYLLWPPLLLGLIRNKKRNGKLFSFFFVTSLALAVVVTPQSPGMAFYAPWTRAWEFLAGAALALWPLSQQSSLLRDSRKSEYLCGASVLLLLGSVFLLNGTQSFPGWRAICPVLGAAGFLTFISSTEFWRTIFAQRILAGIGLISYPLYLWHWPLLALFRRIFPTGILSPWAHQISIAALVLLALALSVATYFFIEKPIRWAQPRSRRARTTQYAGGLLLAGAIAAAIVVAGQGFPQRHHGGDEQVQTVWAATLSDRSRCQKEFENVEFCAIADAQRTPDVVLMGDSHALAIFYGVAEHFAKKGDNVLLLAQGSFPPLPGVEIPDQRESPFQERWQRVLAMDSVKAIVVNATWSSYYDTLNPNGTDRFPMIDTLNPAHKTNREIFEAGLKRLKDQVQATGKKLIFIHTVPEPGLDPTSCLSERTPSRLQLPAREDCSVDRSEVEHDQQGYRQVAQQILADGSVVIFDPVPHFCDEQHCYARREKVLYSDGSHLSVAGSRWIGRFMDF